MKLFLQCFGIAFLAVIVATAINPSPLPSEWLIGDCIAAALIAAPLVRRLSARLTPVSIDFEFEIVTDEEYEELSR